MKEKMTGPKSTPHLILFGVLLLTSPVPAFARIQPSSSLLKADLAALKSAEFGPILKRWEDLYGVSAVAPLLQIARTGTQPDPDRYIALMGAAKLGGTAVAPTLIPFLSDASWMVRSAALQALRTVGDVRSGESALPLLSDPALVVRKEAVETVEKLQPPGAAAALIKAIYSEDNYADGRALWIPQAALRALISLKAQSEAPSLRALLINSEDPELLTRTIRTLEALTGHVLTDARIPLTAQALEWEKYLRPHAP